MAKRPKYPLTEDAKQFAKALVDAWDSGQIEQRTLITVTTKVNKQTNRNARVAYIISDKNRDQPLSPHALYELANFGLIDLSKGWNILLFQELRNAVTNDFEVSDYFLTMNAVGTIVYGNLEVNEGAMFQSAATNEGNVIQNTVQLATQLEELLGESTLNAHPELQKAIEALRDDNGDALTRKEKLGKVISQLGNNLAHMNNAVGAIQLLAMFSKGL